MTGNVKSMNALDNLLLAIFGFSFVVPTIVQSYGLDTRLVWTPTIFYAFWILYKAYLKPSYFLSDYPERAIIERIRGWSYVFSLALTLLGNYVMMEFAPRTIDVFLLGIMSIGFMLIVIVRLLPRKFFKKEIVYMDENQEREIYMILKEAGSAAIFLSVAVVSLNLEFIGSTEFSIESAILTLFIVFALFAYAIIRERKSSNLARELAISLINSRWYKRYSARPKK